jgi:hypothetical protein
MKHHHFSPGKQVRRSAQFLRSFGKYWEAVLPTFLLIINESDKKCEKKKKLAKWEAVSAQFPVRGNWQSCIYTQLRYPDHVESLAEKARRLNDYPYGPRDLCATSVTSVVDLNPNTRQPS